MVDVVSSNHVEHLLNYLDDHWNELSEIERAWDTEMDDIDKEVFQLEWTIKDDKLARLHELAATGALNPQQRDRYDALLRLVAQRQPLLERLFSSE